MGIRTAARFRSSIALAILTLLSGCRVERTQTAYLRVWSFYTSGNLREAAQAARKEAETFQHRGDALWFRKFSLLRAEALLAQANTKEASALLKEPVPASLESNQLELRRNMDQADACSKSGQLQQALSILIRVRPLAIDPELQLRMDVLLGAVLARLGELDRAEEILHRATLEAERNGDFFQLGAALLNLSSVRKWEFHYGEAVEYGLKEVQIAEKYGFRRLAAVEYMNLGSFYRILGDYDRALQNEQKAIDALTRIGDRGNLLIAVGELGLLYEFQGQFDNATAEYERAFELAHNMNRNSDAARNADNLASVFVKRAQWDKAEQWNEKSREMATPESGSGPYETMNAARIADGRGEMEAAIKMYEVLARTPGLYPALEWDSHMYLAEAYAKQRKYVQADRQFRAALEAIDKTRSDLLRPEFQISFLSRLIAIHQEYVDFLIDRDNDRGALRVVESSRARVLSERLGRDVRELQAFDPARMVRLARDTHTSVISFWIAPKRSFAWLIDQSGTQRFTLPPATEIEPLVTAYRGVVEHALKDPIQSNDPAGAKLWNALLRDMAPKIPKNSRVVVVPDGPLHRLNLETLPVPSPQPHYWIEDVELAVAPSIAIAASTPPPVKQRNASLLLIGAPDYSGTDYKPLDKAGAEIQDIEARFRGVTQAVYTGRRASPDCYRSSQPGRFSLIHFAAHADASNENPLESAVILSRRGEAYKLYARDVIDQPIQADLVTISGCRSAGVRAYAGEGLIGFAWAFLQAGARAVVAGLWDVSDVSTEPLMNEFYGGIAAGEPPSAAMRRAKLALKHEPAYSKPFYWAPFQVYVRSIRK